MDDQELELKDEEIEEIEKHLLWQAEQCMPHFKGDCETPEEKLRFLRDVLEKEREEYLNLHIEWEKCMPILHGGIILYYERIEGVSSRNKVRAISSDLIMSVVHLLQSGGHRNNMVACLKRQILNIDKIIQAKYPAPEVAEEQPG